jgi:site-specific recombinase XerD
MNTQLTLSYAINRFLMEDRAASTRNTYRSVLVKAQTFFGPDRFVGLITREDILQYVDSLRNQTERYAEHPRRPPDHGGLSPSTIEKRIKTLTTFFNWLEREGFIEVSPARNLKLRRYHRPPGTSRAATPKELQAVLAVAEAKARLGNFKHLAIFLFLCDTGCRAGEAADLLIGNLHIPQLGAWVLGKGDKMRPVFFGQRTATALSTWLDKHPNPVPDAQLFALQDGSVLSQVIRRMAQEAGLKRPLAAHAIRHRVGQVWATARMGEQTTQLKLGHDDPAVTIEMYYNQTYDHVQQASVELSLASIYGLPSEPVRMAGPQFAPLQAQRQIESGARLIQK